MKNLSRKFLLLLPIFLLPVSSALVAMAVLTVPSMVFAQTFSLEELEHRRVERRAVDAAIWGMPTINFDAMRQAYLRDGEAKYGDIIWWPEGSSWRNQSLTGNTTARYLYAFLNTKKSGPIVLDLPAAMKGSRLLGTIEDAWFVPLRDVGGDGKAGKYLILPPDYTGKVPAGFIPVRPKTFNTKALMRSILASRSEKDRRLGDAMVAQIKIYPLANADNPPEQRFVDMTDKMYRGLVKYDEGMYTSLARMLNEEPAQPRDLQMMGMLLPLGIEKGKEFKPDAATVVQLKAAAAEAHAWFRAKLPTFTSDWWPGSQWKIPGAPIVPQTGFKFAVDNYFDVDSRGIGFYSFFSPPAKLGGGSFYLGANFDSSGQPFQGANTYRLHVPPNVPVSQFWALTVYDSETAAVILNHDTPTLDSLSKGLQKNADGSVDIYLGPKALAGRESNWIHTPPGNGWFAWFRFYGPEQPLFDKSWTMPDIEKVK